MQAKVIVESGASAGKELNLEIGQSVTIGRVEQADLIIRDDPMLSNLHFSLAWDGQTCHLIDLKTRFGTLVNRTKITEIDLNDKDEIKAGQTTFSVRLPPSGRKAAEPSEIIATPAVAQARIPTAAERTSEKPVQLLNFFQQQTEPLFVILDAARDPQIYVRLLQCKEQFQTLYEGVKGEALAPQGPFLVSLPPTSPFLEALLRDGWGLSWGVFLTSAKPFAEVRRHFRHFLLAKLPDGKEVYFRFYDPRVLRIYLPSCSPEDLEVFFGPVSAFHLEGKTPDTILQFGPKTPQPVVRAVMV